MRVPHCLRPLADCLTRSRSRLGPRRPVFRPRVEARSRVTFFPGLQDYE